ncbi:MAG: hypothetical protein KAJ10_10300 [Thermodesulfovibrionia bacterium]|nr:hypothetical protein [Thermodesulfovibrionia bacterium]
MNPGAKHFRQVDAPPGVKDLFSLLAFMDDRKAVEKHVKQLEALRDEVNASIAVVGKVKDIDKLKETATIDRDKAAEAAANANEKAEAIVTEATKEAETAIQVAKEATERLAEDRAGFKSLHKEMSDRLRMLEADLNKRETAIKGRETKASNLEARLKVEKAEVDEKKELLAKILK